MGLCGSGQNSLAHAKRGVSKRFLPFVESKRPKKKCWLRGGAGRGGFSHARPRPYTGRGDISSVIPLPPLSGAHPMVTPWKGPRFLPPILDRACPGAWVGRGKGRGMEEKRRGIWPGARRSLGHGGPVTSYLKDGIQDK